MINYRIIILYCLYSKTLSGLSTKSFGCECGRDPNNQHQNAYKVAEKTKWNVQQRIVGGEKVENPNPWFVFLQFQRKGSFRWLRCGGTLLNQRWALTAAHCFCHDKIKKGEFACKMKDDRLVWDDNLTTVAAYFGILVGHVRRAKFMQMRGISEVIIHEGFDQTDANALNDIALIRFDRPLLQKNMFQNSSTRAIFPICLPDSSYNETDKISFVTGLGLERQDTCRTNGKGPEIYSTCAFGSIYKERERKTNEEITKIDRHKNRNNQWICLSGSPRISLDPQCKAFNYLHNREFKKTDEIVLVPKDRSRAPRACFNEKSQFKHSTNKAETSIGWCGTCDHTAKNNTPGYCGKDADIKDEANYAIITANSGWGYCTEDCRLGQQRQPAKKLSIVHQSILPASDCRRLLDGLDSNKSLHEDKQLCVGHKLELTAPIFYEYEGEMPREIKFEKMMPIINYKSSRGKFVPGLNYMIGGKDSCHGDSGGPLWTREGEGEKFAYLVGIVSAGSAADCANLNIPAFYTKVKHYVSWIKKHASDGACGLPSGKSLSKKSFGESVQKQEEEGIDKGQKGNQDNRKMNAKEHVSETNSGSWEDVYNLKYWEERMIKAKDKMKKEEGDDDGRKVKKSSKGRRKKKKIPKKRRRKRKQKKSGRKKKKSRKTKRKIA